MSSQSKKPINSAYIYRDNRPAPSYKHISFAVPEEKRGHLSDYIERIKIAMKFNWVFATEDAQARAREDAAAFGDIYKGWLARPEDPDRAVLASLGYDGELATFIYDDNDEMAKQFCQCVAVCANAYDIIADTSDIQHWPRRSRQYGEFVAKYGKEPDEFCIDEQLFAMTDAVRFAVSLFGNIDTYGWQRLRKRTAKNSFLDGYHGIKTPEELECAAIYEQVSNLEVKALAMIIKKSTTQQSDSKMRKISVEGLSPKRVSGMMSAATCDSADFEWDRKDPDKARRILENVKSVKEIWEKMPELSETERAETIANIDALGGNSHFLPERVRAVALMRDVDLQMGAQRNSTSGQKKLSIVV